LVRLFYCSKQLQKAGLKDAGDNVDDPNVQKNAEETAKKLVSDKSDAVTLADLVVNRTFTRDKDGKVGAAKVTYRDFVVTLLPANAGTQLKNHEDGHVLIQKLLKDHGKTKFEEAFGEAKGKTVDEANKIFEKTSNDIVNVGRDAQSRYDKTTEDGTSRGFLQGGGEEEMNRSLLLRE
jgi:hypothetical protein